LYINDNSKDYEDEEFEGEILEYFEDEYQEYWRSQIVRAEWEGAQKLYELLEQNKVKKIYGEKTKLFLLADGESLLAFCLLAQKNTHKILFKKPWIDFLFTFPSQCKKGYAKLLINHAAETAKNDGYKNLYVLSESEGFFEKCGFSLASQKQYSGKVLKIYNRPL
jgi:N-acetylglutamate synthase-like GNAT family acetyltransferase